MDPNFQPIRKVAILGAGIWGLSLAHFLRTHSKNLWKITVFEKSDRPGGMIGTRTLDGCKMETGPNGFLDSNPATMQLCRSLGLEEELLGASSTAARNRFLYVRSKLHKLPSSLAGMAFSQVISFWAKLKILGEFWNRSNEIPQDESIYEFFDRRFGTEVARTLGDAFVTGIWGGDSTQLSLPSCFPKLRQLEKEHGSLLRGIRAQRIAKRKKATERKEPIPPPPRMWSLKGGLGDLVAKLAGNLGTALALGCGEITIRPREVESGTVWEVSPNHSNQSDLFDHVVLACPAREQARILSTLAPDLTADLETQKTNTIGVVGLVFPTRQLTDRAVRPDGFGYLTPQRDGRPVIGLQWCSSIYPGFRSPPDKQLWRALIGGPRHPELLERENQEIAQIVLDELRLVGGWELKPERVEIIRWTQGIPQYTVGHRKWLERLEQRAARFPGLTIGGSCLRGVAINDCVEQADNLAQKILAGSEPKSPG